MHILLEFACILYVTSRRIWSEHGFVWPNLTCVNRNIRLTYNRTYGGSPTVQLEWWKNANSITFKPAMQSGSFNNIENNNMNQLALQITLNRIYDAIFTWRCRHVFYELLLHTESLPCSHIFFPAPLQEEAICHVVVYELLLISYPQTLISHCDIMVIAKVLLGFRLTSLPLTLKHNRTEGAGNYKH